jgi:hypothetical protein
MKAFDSEYDTPVYTGKNELLLVAECGNGCCTLRL